MTRDGVGEDRRPRSAWRVVDDWLRRQHPGGLILASLVLVGGVAMGDVATGHEISLSLLYVVPVGIASWYVGRVMGGAIAVACAAAWVVTDHLTGHAWELAFARYWDAGAVRLGFLLVVALLLAGLRRHVDREAKLARTDDLTGALNRRAFAEESARLLRLASREGSPVTMVCMDVDDFKLVNDTRGHAAGDRLLRAACDALGCSLRTTDVVARLGGDEFAVLLPMTDEAGARTVVERAREQLYKTMRAAGWHVTFSIGVVTFPAPPDEADAALRAVDALMYRVKTGGKNGVAYDVARTVRAG